MIRNDVIILQYVQLKDALLFGNTFAMDFYLPLKLKLIHLNGNGSWYR